MPNDNNADALAVARWARAFDSYGDFSISTHFPWVDNCRVVLIGESTHGTHEFYRLREFMTRQLIDRHRFTFLAVEADWPDAERVDAYVRQLGPREAPEGGVFSRFPEWMWRNAEFLSFVEWLEQRNAALREDRKTAFHGLDLYSLRSSITEVLRYLDKRDARLGALARERYGCLLPFAEEPHAYGEAVMLRRHRECEGEVAAMLADLLRRRIEKALLGGARVFDAEQNARIIMNAERYYRSVYRGPAESWNVRDRHMFETLLELLELHGADSKAIIWAHNSHIGDATATEMSRHGELNLGQLCREHFGEEAGLIGMGTHGGAVAAARAWDQPVEIRQINESLEGSHERLCHDTGVSRFSLNLRDAPIDVKLTLKEERLERAIGVIYRPETERHSHYFHARLAPQFDGWIWIDQTQAVTPLVGEQAERLPATHPLA